ncbi:nyn domain-containing protein [Gigaspora margarita]|uniref:Nyn domain-containing protein n=1 Tax=Gigaspora margarita TaxID=4874 RepID=A0A8H4APQ3_GIGMA|nr:nyn domain-containing protein [Gigaspora margarita]
MQLAKLVTDIKKPNTPKSNSGLVSVFVDNSNLFIEEKYTVGRIEKDPGTILLVAGDSDYYPVLTRALDKNWKVETWFWSLGSFKKKLTLEITDGETLAKWNDDEVMECFESLELFGWWFRKEGPSIYFYFDNKSNLTKAKNWMDPIIRI